MNQSLKDKIAATDAEIAKLEQELIKLRSRKQTLEEIAKDFPKQVSIQPYTAKPAEKTFLVPLTKKKTPVRNYGQKEWDQVFQYIGDSKWRDYDNVLAFIHQKKWTMTRYGLYWQIKHREEEGLVVRKGKSKFRLTQQGMEHFSKQVINKPAITIVPAAQSVALQ
jgi:hypothetical protein